MIAVWPQYLGSRETIAWVQSQTPTTWKNINLNTQTDCWRTSHTHSHTEGKIVFKVVYLPGCLVSRRCGSVSQGRLAHPRSCQCQLGWEAGRPSPLPQSEGSREAAASCTQAERTHTSSHINDGQAHEDQIFRLSKRFFILLPDLNTYKVF